jgi:hypothetical protein
MNQGLGEARGGISLEELPMGSVVYLGRGAFRMEAVGPEGLDGVVRPVTGAVTAPYRADDAPREITGVDLLPEPRPSGAPVLASLFGSQVDVPVLAPPTAAVAPAQRTGTRWLAALGAIVFASGIAIGAAVMRSAPAPTAAPAVERAPVPPVIEPLPLEATVAPPATTPAEGPVRIGVRKKAAARRAPVAPAAQEPAKPWVDPFAD